MVRPKLGITTRNVELLKGQLELPVDDGVLVWQVVPGQAAANAGLRGLTQTENGEVALGDIITSLDGEKVGNADDLFRILDKHKVGDTVQVGIFRNGRRTTVPVQLTQGPDTRRGTMRRQ